MTDIVEEIESALTPALEDRPLPWTLERHNSNVYSGADWVAADMPTEAIGKFIAASPDLLQRAKDEIVRLREWLKVIKRDSGDPFEVVYYHARAALDGKSPEGE